MAMGVSRQYPPLVIIPWIAAYYSLFLCIMLPNKVRSQTISFQIDSFDSTTAKDILTLERDALVPSGSSFLRLTKPDAWGYPEEGSVGRVLYNSPVTLWEPGRQATFEVTIAFQITTVNDNPADGLTFFIVPVNSTTPTGGEGVGLGIFNSTLPNSPIFAVEFDTYLNPDIDWPDHPHIGIDYNSGYSQAVTTFEDARNKVVTALIQYEPNRGIISVSATYGSHTHGVSNGYDLKTLLPQQVQVGISASTGGQVAVFDLLKWYFTSTLVWDGNNNYKKINDEDAYLKQYA